MNLNSQTKQNKTKTGKQEFINKRRWICVTYEILSFFPSPLFPFSLYLLTEKIRQMNKKLVNHLITYTHAFMLHTLSYFEYSFTTETIFPLEITIQPTHENYLFTYRYSIDI